MLAEVSYYSKYILHMKRIFLISLVALSIFACKPKISSEQAYVLAELDLVNTQDDRVFVSIDPGKITQEEIRFYIPKTVPGTYALNSYGQFSEDLVAYDYKGKEMEVIREDEDTWLIKNATNFDKLTYYTNDTFDIPGEGEVFSPAGTNIAHNENFLLNLHAFVGYFEDKKEEPYKLLVKRPTHLEASASIEVINQTKEDNYVIDEFYMPRYFSVIDHPIMYSVPDVVSFDISGMKVVLSVYSPNQMHSTKSLKKSIERMVNAQKNFLGEIDNTSIYAILLYLSDTNKQDASGFGALEHHTSTVVVLPEAMPVSELEKYLTDIVSHEFFHIISPLNVHSEEIHYFDYNNPQMSQHLWMYEGVTEYFANLFQVTEGLISEEEFLERIAEKIETSMNFDDEMSFTEMSRNILEDEYSPSYYNVYLKGALIGMALDLELRELSGGTYGVLHLMKDLIEEYGVDHPFKDDELFDVIVAKTYPQIADFFATYVSGTTPIPYSSYFESVGVEATSTTEEVGYLLDGQVPLIDANPETKELFFRKEIPISSTFGAMGIQPGDIILEVNGEVYNIDNVYALLSASFSWNEETHLQLKVKRGDEELLVEGKATQPMVEKTKLSLVELEEEDARFQLRKVWLNSK